MLAGLAVLGTATPTRATGFTDLGDDIQAHDEAAVELDGYFRLRGEALHNLDLDRGPTPSGDVFFPVPVGDPAAQTLLSTDMRLRTDVAVYAPGGMVAVKLRVDTLDNVVLGSVPEGTPVTTTTQRAAGAAMLVRRAYGEVVTPVGVIAAGRMGNTWGLGMLANGGDCADCDSGDAADRVAFLTPLAGHVWAVAFDIASTGPLAARRAGYRAVDVEPSDDVRTLTFAVLESRSETARRRRARAGKTTVDYGAYVSHRWQTRDVPASYLPASVPVQLTSAQVVPRGFSATAVDGWVRVETPSLRVELEAAYLHADIAEASLLPGVRFRDGITSRQWGVALESEWRPTERVAIGLDAGAASGDAAPGFGAFPAAGGRAPLPGDLDGPQAALPFDTTVNNFRFHPDYRVDRILFREIVGTVTDAVYVRPHVRVRLASFFGGHLDAQVAAIASFAMEPTSAPGGERPLGVELDPTIAYRSRDGFAAALEHAVLFPLGGLGNRDLGLSARPAQLLRLRLQYFF
jgi:uncharacterized protein (TIGR04551 family)